MGALVDVRHLVKHFPVKRSLADVIAGRRLAVHAVDDVSFTLDENETVGLLGESGCGKTTTGRLLLKLDTPTSGEIHIGGQDLATIQGEQLKAFRRTAQLVFQNPFDALNPRFDMRRILSEPLINAGIPKAEYADRITAALERVRMRGIGDLMDKYPHQLSGGQLQRIVLARALILGPKFIVADEPVSMLDVSVRAGVLNLMREIQESLGLTAIYISHDLALVRYVAARTMVMYLATIVEDGPTERVISAPAHPYTKALISAVPIPRVDQNRGPLPISGNVPDARRPPAGCRFHDRCPLAVARCRQEVPVLREVAPKHRAACHLL